MMIAWSDMRTGNQDLAYRRSTDTGASFAGLTFLVRASSDDSQPSIRCDGADALLTWVEESGGNKNIAFRYSGNGGASFGAKAKLVAASTDEYGPACDVDSAEAACVWADTRDGTPKPHARESLNGGATWLTRFELDP